MEIVSKCGIATTAREENVIGHYITDRDHIIKSAEQSLINLATDHLDLLLIHRPDPLMDADEVADAFKHLHQSGKVRTIFGVSNFTPAQFALLQSRLPFTLATNQVEISRISRYCWMARSTNYNNCVFVRWRGPALVVVVCLMMIISSRCVMNWLWWQRS